MIKTIKKFLFKLARSIKKKIYRLFGIKNASEKINAERIKLVKKYLHGLNGIEIGGSGRGFGLDSQKGSYANVDIIDAETRSRFKGWKKSQLVNILSSGDDLPFKDGVLDYVFSSHVIEHFFDPIKAIKEWYRVIKKGGYIIMVIPHKERTFDRNRDITDSKELIDRHQNNIFIKNYIRRTDKEKNKHETEYDKDHHKLIYNEDIPNGWERFIDYDFFHHWSVWDTKTFEELCSKMDWNTIEIMDTRMDFDNEFVVILRK